MRTVTLQSATTSAIGALLALCLTTPAFAASLLLSADSTSIPVGASTQIHIEVQGTQLNAAPRLVNSEGFDVEMAGRSSSFTMSQGRVSQQTTYTFTVLARQPGQHTLGPAEALVDGKRVLSDALTMTVLAANARRAGTSGAGAAPANADQRWFAHAELSKPRPFEGESVSYVLSVGTAVSVRGTRWTKPAWGKLSPAPGVDAAQSDRLEVIDGRRFEVTTLVMPLFALESGPTRIEPSIMEFTVPQRSRSFFDLGAGKQFQHPSEALDLTVRPLPLEGRPASFSGAVGRFSLTASIDRNRLAAGETVTLVVRLAGSGGLRGAEIDLQLPDTVRRYSEQPEQTSKLIGHGLRTELTLREALVPLEPGPITIPPVSFSFFDPHDEQYRTVHTRPIQLHVGGEAVTDPAVVARSASLARSKEAIEVLGSDLVGLHGEELTRGDKRLSLHSASVLVALLLPLFGFGSVTSILARRRMSGTSAGRARERDRQAREARKEVQRAGARGLLDDTERAWRTWLGARLDRSGSALSPADTRSILMTAGLSQELAGQGASLLESLESVRYGGAPEGSLAQDIATWTEAAHKEWK